MGLFQKLKSPPSEEFLPQEPFRKAYESFFTMPADSHTQEEIAHAANSLDEDFKKWNDEENRRLKNALRLISICTLLRNSVLSSPNKARGHYIWCPYEHWMDSKEI